ncbi:SMI1/KNR4 family protein [Enterococcus sp. BWR-S5]|uniref:SMI1/KNR4 family protein n=1 Tax=Enterococcus sp. BWR-S5 TaxID=2787714 RepID=UPI0019233E40|nr:SMI1/KNR4 family protein [Enterococcus sp. BWR-S5]MBL1226131.1 SMI1/KNR4 family protein [Enterococcus sp. BWR-S5]
MLNTIKKLFLKKSRKEESKSLEAVEWSPYTDERLTNAHGVYIQNLVAMAGKVDAERKVFGSSKHKYQLRPVLSLEELKAFEVKYQISLPEEYVFFLTHVGNGGAGPYYGLTTLEKLIGTEEHAAAIRNEALIDKKLSRAQWQQLMDETEEDDDLYDKAMERLYGGMLNIGTQGCTYDNLLMLSGSEAGKIVYIDWNLFSDYPPYLTNMTFLDWYENYFKEIIQGNSTSSYGYFRLGSEEKLKRDYATANKEEKHDILRSLYRFSAVDDHTVAFIQQREDKELDTLRLDLLLKFDEAAAMEMFHLLLSGENSEAAVACARRIPEAEKDGYYTTMAKLLWDETLQEKSRVIFFMKECSVFTGKDLLAFAMDKTLAENDRKTAVWAISNAKDCMTYLNEFILWMDEESYWVAHAALQGMAREQHPKLVDAYYRMWEKYSTDQTMRSNLVIAFENNGIQIEKEMSQR